mmetsp:Transcript_36789/g.147133  ORF Transcript_36789/g.147133 Transcript_36789/m.147133 type:complete len:147 (-) Transcript_36789:1053-1493(-)
MSEQELLILQPEGSKLLGIFQRRFAKLRISENAEASAEARVDLSAELEVSDSPGIAVLSRADGNIRSLDGELVKDMFACVFTIEQQVGTEIITVHPAAHGTCAETARCLGRCDRYSFPSQFLSRLAGKIASHAARLALPHLRRRPC